MINVILDKLKKYCKAHGLSSIATVTDFRTLGGLPIAGHAKDDIFYYYDSLNQAMASYISIKDPKFFSVIERALFNHG